MFELNLSSFNQETFLRDYWQKKPVVIRQGFVDFEDPICADEMAGLACEEQIESRLVYKKEGDWQAEFGPFQSYAHLGEKDWSLVIQALDHWSEEAAQIIEPFRFIPNWRLDDVMASFATQGGSVGPHLDLYDTFICQGSGKRHWRVGNKGDHIQFSAHEALLHVKPFEAIIDVELAKGDILYIPPGFPHEGVSLDTSLSFSVGFRTNSSASLLSGLADYLIDSDQGTELIEDAGRVASNSSGAINNSDYALIKQQMQSVLDNDTLFRQFVGSYQTQSKHELDLVAQQPAYQHSDVAEILQQANLMRLGGLRAFYFPKTLEQGICYIDGIAVNFPATIADAIKLMCDNVQLSADSLACWSENDDFIEFLTLQVNTGYWYFSDDS